MYGFPLHSTQLYVDKEEPTFKMVSAGNFEVTEGHAGYSIDADAIKEQVKTALNEASRDYRSDSRRNR